jgi:hypothetical protein
MAGAAVEAPPRSPARFTECAELCSAYLPPRWPLPRPRHRWTVGSRSFRPRGRPLPSSALCLGGDRLARGEGLDPSSSWNLDSRVVPGDRESRVNCSDLRLRYYLLRRVPVLFLFTFFFCLFFYFCFFFRQPRALTPSASSLSRPAMPLVYGLHNNNTPQLAQSISIGIPPKSLVRFKVFSTFALPLPLPRPLPRRILSICAFSLRALLIGRLSGPTLLQLCTVSPLSYLKLMASLLFSKRRSPRVPTLHEFTELRELLSPRSTTLSLGSEARGRYVYHFNHDHFKVPVNFIPASYPKPTLPTAIPKLRQCQRT